MKKLSGLRLYLLLLVLVAVVLLVTLVVTNITLTQKEIRSTINERGLESTNFLVDLVYNTFDGYMKELKVLSEMDLIRTMDWEQMKDFLKNFESQRTDYWEMLFVNNMEGNAWTQTGIVNISDRDYFIEDMRQGKNWIISNPVVSKATNEMITVLAVPIRHQNKVIGYLCGTLKLGVLQEKIEKMMDGKDLYADNYIIDQNGLIIAHPNRDYIMELNITEQSKLVSNAMVEFAKKSLQKDIHNGEYVFDSIAKSAFSRKIPGTKGWVFVTTYVRSNIYKQLNAQKRVSIIIAVIASIAMVTISLFITQRIITKINRVVDFSIQFGQGDLTVRAEGNSDDELGVLAKQFNDMGGKIQKLISKIASVSKSVNTASEQLAKASLDSSAVSQEISASIEEVAARANDQSSNMEQASALLKDLSGEIKVLGEVGSKVRESAIQTNTQATQGKSAIHSITLQMNEIKETIEKTSNVINELVKNSEEIGNIVEIINSIANQTQLLALNAAIEAARAGEAGRGFSVVADEIKKLAEETVESAKQINELIGETQKSSSEADNSMKQGVDKVIKGNQVINETTGIFDQIVHASQDNLDFTTKVSSSMTKLVEMSEKILERIGDVVAISEETSASAQQVSASTEEQAATIEEISAMADSLQQLAADLEKQIRQFKY